MNQFLDMLNFHRWLIPDCSTVVLPLITPISSENGTIELSPNRMKLSRGLRSCLSNTSLSRIQHQKLNFSKWFLSLLSQFKGQSQILNRKLMSFDPSASQKILFCTYKRIVGLLSVSEALTTFY